MDRGKFHDFYEETASSLRAYLRMACRNRALADDLMHETYLRMLQRQLPELDAAQRKAYLYKTARSALADHYRDRRREARFMERHASPDGTERGSFDTLFAQDDRRAVDAFDLPLDMQRVFDTLKARQQTLLWLAYVEGFKHKEIAEVIGVNATSVRVMLSRARADLASKLSVRGLAPVAARGGRK